MLAPGSTNESGSAATPANLRPRNSARIPPHPRSRSRASRPVASWRTAPTPPPRPPQSRHLKTASTGVRLRDRSASQPTAPPATPPPLCDRNSKSSTSRPPSATASGTPPFPQTPPLSTRARTALDHRSGPAPPPASPPVAHPTKRRTDPPARAITPQARHSETPCHHRPSIADRPRTVSTSITLRPDFNAGGRGTAPSEIKGRWAGITKLRRQRRRQVQNTSVLSIPALPPSKKRPEVPREGSTTPLPRTLRGPRAAIEWRTHRDPCPPSRRVVDHHSTAVQLRLLCHQRQP